MQAPGLHVQPFWDLFKQALDTNMRSEKGYLFKQVDLRPAPDKKLLKAGRARLFKQVLFEQVQILFSSRSA